MRSLPAFVFMVALVMVPVAAATAPVSDKPPAGQTETIKVSKAVDLLNAITVITGNHEVIVGQGASAHTAQIPYELNADTLWALKDDISILRHLVEIAQEDQRHLVSQAEAANGGPLKPKTEAVYDANHNMVAPEVPSDAQVALNKKVQELMDSPREINKLFHIKRDDLKKAMSSDQGHPAGSILSSLDPILDP